MSMSHLKEIAEESGFEFEQYHSNEKTFRREGFKIETWYDENASSALSAWGAFVYGVGSCYGPDVDIAIDRIISRAKAQPKQ